LIVERLLIPAPTRRGFRRGSELKISVVSTLYRSAATIDEFYRRALEAASALSEDVELVLVNDGSPDGSLERALALNAADPRVVVIDLARNFGHHKAMMTGLAYAQGDLVFLIDSDLEEEPELLDRFHRRLGAGDCDVVYGVQDQRRGTFFERTAGDLFFSLVKLMSDHPLPRNIVTARLMTRDYVRALVRHRDREFLIGQLWLLSGFRQVALPVTKLSRSPSNYSLGKRIDMAIKYLTTTSTKLLYLVFYAGVIVSCMSVITILYFVFRYLLADIGVDGWTSLIVSIWFFGGVITLILGILGIYVANILSESKRRPYTVVRRVYRAPEEAGAARPRVVPDRLPKTRAEGNRTR
jgi:putative glycosyltransferase